MTVITCGSRKEDKGFLCVWLLYDNFADLRMEVPRYQSSPTLLFFSVDSAAVKC